MPRNLQSATFEQFVLIGGDAGMGHFSRGPQRHELMITHPCIFLVQKRL